MMKNFRLLLGIVILFLLLWVFYDYSFNHRISLIGFDEEPQSRAPRTVPYWQVIFSGLAMLMGILFGSIYENLKTRKKAVDFKRELSRSLRSAGFFKAILASPIVFAGVYVASRSQPEFVIALLFAFQNGFFCDAILRESTEQGPRNK